MSKDDLMMLDTVKDYEKWLDRVNKSRAQPKVDYTNYLQQKSDRLNNMYKFLTKSEKILHTIQESEDELIYVSER